MKRKLVAIAIATLIFLAPSCSKIEPVKQPEPEIKPFNFNLNSNSVEARCLELTNAEKTGSAMKLTAMHNATASEPFVVFAAIYGDTVNNSNWNNGNQFIVTMADTNTVKQGLAIAKERFSIFPHVIITTDKAVWEATDVSLRVKIIIGNTNALGQYLGYAWVNCYLWQDDTPSFLLVNNCNPLFLVDDIGNGIAHEIAHMFGREHTYGSWGSGFMSRATTMGNWYNKTFKIWTEDDINALKLIFGIMSDDHPNTTSQYVYNPENFGKQVECILSQNDLADVLRIKPDPGVAKPLTFTTGGGCPIRLKVLKLNGQQVLTKVTSTSLSVTVTIPKGTAYLYLVFERYVTGTFTATTGTTKVTVDNYWKQK